MQTQWARIELGLGLGLALGGRGLCHCQALFKTEQRGDNCFK